MLFLLTTALFMVSGDVFFVFEAGGLTVRVFQFLLIPVIAKGLLGLLSGHKLFRYPIGFGMLALWSCFVLAFVPNTSYLPRNLFYAGWLVFDVLMVLGITAVVNTPAKLFRILRWYIYSFVFSAVFGLLQIGLPLVGISAPLVKQWWFPGVLARINGFTYEPSYYATYMITGWVLVDYLRFRGVKVISWLDQAFWLITAAIFLSSSRMGWLMMLAWVALRTFWRFREKGLALPWKKLAVAVAIPAALVSFAASRYRIYPEDLLFLASGMGVFDAASHSRDERLSTFDETLEVFLDHPVIGVSLGGVATAIGHLRHDEVRDNESAKQNEGQCTTAEVLAASGIFGFIPYLLYITGLIITSIQRTDQSGLGLVVKGLGWSLLFIILILQFNQTILRGYLWLHIGILSAAFGVFQAISSKPVRMAPRRPELGLVPAS